MTALLVRARGGARAQWTAAGVLLLVTFFWGTTFLVVKNATAHMPVLWFLALRFALAAAVMIAARPRALVRLPRAQWRHGLWAGLALAGGYITQTVGLQTTASSVSGFLTGMFVVFTPLVAWAVSRRRPLGGTWISVGLATVGLALISLQNLGLGVGEALTLLCALFFAMQLVMLERWSTRPDAYGLAVVQLLVVAVLCAAGAPLYGGIGWPSGASDWAAIAFCAVCATAFAFFGQTWAQSVLPAARCAIIMTMEPVFAGLTGVLVGGDAFGWRLGMGGACILGAMLVAELWHRTTRRNVRRRHTPGRYDTGRQSGT